VLVEVELLVAELVLEEVLLDVDVVVGVEVVAPPPPPLPVAVTPPGGSRW
jgi:hypothetical protein